MSVLLCYWPAGRNGFVWDDTALVLRDPLIRSWRLIPEGFRHFLFLDATGADFYRPIQRLSFTLDYALFGFAPAGWHYMSVGIHAAAAVVLYALLRRWLGQGRDPWAAAAAITWAIHPIHTSAVTYVAGRADPLAALFGFTALTLGLRSLEGGKRTSLAMAGAAFCFLAAMLSKESGAVFLAIWLFVLAWRRAPRRVWLNWMGIFAVLLGAVIGLRKTAHRTPPPPPAQPTPFVARPILAARAVAEYAGLFLMPKTLRMERDVTTRPQSTPEATQRNAKRREWQTLLGVLLIGGGFLWLRWTRKNSPEACAALLAALIAYLPISNLFALNATVAEHWLYVPSAFLLAALAVSCVRFNPQGYVTVSSVVWMSWYLSLALPGFWDRQSAWLDQRTFLEQTIAAGGDTSRMRGNLGNLELQEGHPDLALEQYRLALERDPESVFAWLGTANAHLRLGHYEKARFALEKCGQAPGLTAELAQFNGALDFAEKQIDPVPAFRRAADAAPLNWNYRKRLLTALAQTGRLDEAIRELRAFLTEQDFRADSWLLLADFLTRAGRSDLAAAALAEAKLRDVRLPSS